mmetsp:Transcript_14321/g.25356  ORF Transcript_14321/g.25356 Transcript_14321/m.25356 type:complete len:201 (-) Transcript_14321:349-951(-)
MGFLKSSANACPRVKSLSSRSKIEKNEGVAPTNPPLSSPSSSCFKSSLASFAFNTRASFVSFHCMSHDVIRSGSPLISNSFHKDAFVKYLFSSKFSLMCVWWPAFLWQHRFQQANRSVARASRDEDRRRRPLRRAAARGWLWRLSGRVQTCTLPKPCTSVHTNISNNDKEKQRRAHVHNTESHQNDSKNVWVSELKIKRH